MQVTASGQHLSLELLSRLAGALGWPGWPSEGNVAMNAKAILESGSPPVFSGSLNLSRAAWAPPWLSQPVRVHNLQIDLAQRRVRATGLVAQLGDAMVTGAVERSVDPSGKPHWQADLHASELGAGGLAALFATRSPAPEWLASLQVSGKVAARLFHLRGLLLENLESTFALSDRRLLLRDAQAGLAGGRVTGVVDMNFSRAAPEYIAPVKLAEVQAGGLIPDLAEGALSGSLELKAQGRTAAELADTLDIQGAFQGRSMHLQNAALAEALRTDRTGAVSAEVRVRDRMLHITRLSLAGPPLLEASGSVGFDRGLDLDFRSFRLAGTLSEPLRVGPNELARRQEK